MDFNHRSDTTSIEALWLYTIRKMKCAIVLHEGQPILLSCPDASIWFNNLYILDNWKFWIQSTFVEGWPCRILLQSHRYIHLNTRIWLRIGHSLYILQEPQFICAYSQYLYLNIQSTFLWIFSDADTSYRAIIACYRVCSSTELFYLPS